MLFVIVTSSMNNVLFVDETIAEVAQPVFLSNTVERSVTFVVSTNCTNPSPLQV